MRRVERAFALLAARASSLQSDTLRCCLWRLRIIASCSRRRRCRDVMDGDGRRVRLRRAWPRCSTHPLYFARRLCAQYIQYGDAIVTPALDDGVAGLDGVVVRSSNRRSSAVLVHREQTATTYDVSDITRPHLPHHCALITIYCHTANASHTH